MSIKEIYKSWKPVIWGLIIGLILGISPFIAQLDEYIPESILYISFIPVKLLAIFVDIEWFTDSVDTAIAYVVLGLYAYPIIGLISGILLKYILDRKSDNNEEKQQQTNQNKN